MVKKTPRQIAANKKRKAKNKDTSTKVASMTMKEMLSYIKDEPGLYKYIKGRTGWTDKQMYIKFMDDPISYGEFKGEFDMMNYSGRGPDD